MPKRAGSDGEDGGAGQEQGLAYVDPNSTSPARYREWIKEKAAAASQQAVETHIGVVERVFRRCLDVTYGHLRIWDEGEIALTPNVCRTAQPVDPLEELPNHFGQDGQTYPALSDYLFKMGAHWGEELPATARTEGTPWSDGDQYLRWVTPARMASCCQGNKLEVDAWNKICAYGTQYLAATKQMLCGKDAPAQYKNILTRLETGQSGEGTLYHERISLP
jgi:hypothetical protein